MPRKILFVESGPGYGGSAFSLFRLVKSLDRSRYEAHVVVCSAAEAFDRIRSLGVPVTTLDVFQPLFGRAAEGHRAWTKARNFCSFYGNLGADTVYNGLRLARYVRRNGIDLVHLNNGILENLSALFAARLVGIPCVSHLRGTEPLLRIERYFVGWTSAVVTLNRKAFNQFAEVFDRDKVHLIWNGVDLDAFQAPNPERIRREFNLEPGTFAAGTFARLVDGKGIPEFIAAAARVSRQCEQSRFFVVGDGSSKDKAFESSMKQLAGEHGLGDKLTFTGWRDDRIDIMAAMDVILQISTTFPEGMSLAPLEAMALGKPVIVTDIPGYEFCVEDGKTGFVVAAGDVDALTEKVLVLAGDRDRAQRMGREGQGKAQRQFDVRLTARAIEKLYDRVLDHHPGRPLGHGAGERQRREPAARGDESHRRTA